MLVPIMAFPFSILFLSNTILSWVSNWGCIQNEILIRYIKIYFPSYKFN